MVRFPLPSPHDPLRQSKRITNGPPGVTRSTARPNPDCGRFSKPEFFKSREALASAFQVLFRVRRAKWIGYGFGVGTGFAARSGSFPIPDWTMSGVVRAGPRRLRVLARSPMIRVAGWLTLALVFATWLYLPSSTGRAWFYFRNAAQLLVHRSPSSGHFDGWRLYDKYPQAQFGPVAILLSRCVLVIAPGSALRVIQIVLVAGYGLIVWLLTDAARRLRPIETHGRAAFSCLAGGCILLPVWMELAVVIAHIDDTLALTGAVCGVWAISTRRPYLAAIVLGIAADAKPWAVVFLALILVIDPAHRRAAAAIALAIAIGPFVPFVVGDPHTLVTLGRFSIANNQSSTLRALGVRASRTPRWDRPAQFALGTVLSVGAYVRGRWEGIILMGVAGRLLLEPGTNHYYTAGLAVGALVWDVLAGTHRWPLLTTWTVGLFELPIHLHLLTRHQIGLLRLLACVGAITVVAFRPKPATPTQNMTLPATRRARSSSLGELDAAPAEGAVPLT